jgi:hypothetical protein
MRRSVLVLAAFALSSCAMMHREPTHLSGEWGGPHVGLVLEGGLGTLQYDCASGTIDTAIDPGPDGRFSAQGTHRPGQGGPVRVGQIFTTHRAEYRGTVTGDVMELTAVLENGQVIGPYTLTRGAEPQLTRCL